MKCCPHCGGDEGITYRLTATDVIGEPWPDSPEAIKTSDQVVETSSKYWREHDQIIGSTIPTCLDCGKRVKIRSNNSTGVAAPMEKTICKNKHLSL